MKCVILADFPRTPKSLVHQQKSITNDIAFENMPKLEYMYLFYIYMYKIHMITYNYIPHKTSLKADKEVWGRGD